MVGATASERFLVRCVVTTALRSIDVINVEIQIKKTFINAFLMKNKKTFINVGNKCPA